MTPTMIKRLPKEAEKKGELYFTDKYYYEEGYSQFWGTKAYFRYKRTKNN